LTAATDEALTAHRNFLVTKQPRYLERQTAARATVDGGLKRVAALTRDNAVQQQNLQLLTKAVQARRVVDDEMTERAGAGDAPADLESAIGREEKLGDNLRAIVAVMEREEDRLMAFRRDRERRQTTRSFVILGVLLLLNFAAVGVVAWLWRRVQRLQRLVTICAWSRLLRHGDEWLSIEDFLEREYGVSVTHGMSEAELAKFSEQLGERDADGAARKN
jgi:CHASE3 domain sensor protein